jgi:hypothetical protein
VTSPESTGPANVRNEESLEKQSQADDIVSQYSDAGGLLLKVADIMLDSMHETYVLLTRKIPFFKGLDPEDMARIYSRENLAVYEVNETIYEQGDPGDFVYLCLLVKSAPWKMANKLPPSNEAIYSGKRYWPANSPDPKRP